jgi:hypothetical protein
MITDLIVGRTADLTPAENRSSTQTESTTVARVLGSQTQEQGYGTLALNKR